MDHQVEPPEKKKNSSPPSFSLLPHDIAASCLARISRSQYPTLSIVSKTFRSLLSSTELYSARSHLGNTEQCVYFCLADWSYQFTQWYTLWINPNRTLPDSTIKRKKKTIAHLVASIPRPNFPSVPNPNGVATYGSEIYVIGGLYNEPPSSAVRVLDCGSHTWRDAPSMIVPRMDPGTCVYNGKIYVIGGCQDDQQPWAEVFDTKAQTWEPLPDPDTDLRKSLIWRIAEIEGTIYIGNTNYGYDTKQGKWECDKGGFFAILPTISKCAVIENVSYFYGRPCCYYPHGCWWYDVKDGGWKGVEGLDSLGDTFVRNGGDSQEGHVTKVASFNGKLLLIWAGRTSRNPNGRMKIWCAQIALEKRDDGGGVWGNVEWVDAVQSVHTGCKLLHCLVVSV